MPADQPATAPPLRWWSHAWRLVAMLTISGLSWSTFAEWQWDHDRWWLAVDLTIGLGCYVLVHYRRRSPLAIAILINVLAFISPTSTGPAVLALVSIAARRRWREILPVGVLSLAGGVFLAQVNPSTTESLPFNVGSTLTVTVLIVGWGLYIGSRRELLATLRERAETAEREQTMRVGQARTAERSRIAREMHDVLAHRISMVAMHAGGLAYRTDLPAEEVRRTSAIIQDNAHRALVDLREVLGVLREGDGSVEDRPQPTLSDLPALVEEARSTGTHVELRNGLLSEPPTALGRTAYRIVQEALTNVRKHAPHTFAEVDVSGGPDDGVSVRVVNPIPVGGPAVNVPRSGLGLIGLSERAALAGGTLECTTTEGRFCVRAWLPWPT